MQKMLLMLALSVFAGAPLTAGAHGCIKGAAVGGVAGHLAGHHGLAGAAVGCAIGHHRAKVKEREKEQDATRAQPAPKANPDVPAAHAGGSQSPRT
jgi:hypothetical protein